MEHSRRTSLRDAERDDLIKTPKSDSLVYSAKEQTILNLWKQEEDLRLQQYFLETQARDDRAPSLTSISDDELDEALKTAEKEASDARAAYALRKRITEHVLIADPVLKAVHIGANGNALEQKLSALINERDILAMVNSTLSKELLDVSQSLTAAETERLHVTSSNSREAKVMLQLAEETKPKEIDDVEDASVRGQLHVLDDQIRSARRDWRIMKSIVSAVVANSGLNWAQDEVLMELVLDNEDEVG